MRIFSRRPRAHVAGAMSAALLSVTLAATAGAQQRTTMQDRIRMEREQQLARQGGFAVIDGVVTDTLLTPLDNADVTVIGTAAKVITGENGRFRMMQVPSGQYLIVVRRIGFAPTSGIIEVPAGDTVRLAYALVRSGMLLDTVRVREQRVSLRMLEFEQRRKLGTGQFVTRDMLERRGSMYAKDFLRNLTGVIVSPLSGDQFAGTVALSKREGGSVFGDGAGACAMQVLLDGIILPRNFNLDLLPPPKQIAGIEVYSGSATVPPQFGGPDRRCGVIAVWTRDGY
ncbi:MAG: carboxypeptidase regulatory-like domain-containing protein [Gemmatimonadaceae bacterium]|nr:carboxypeptidase regulatory-like domain-containing protein [Gemmatimonadaceae bacterium]